MPTTAPARRRLVSLAEAAAQLDVSTRTLRRHISAGALPAYRVGRLVKIDPADLDALARPIPTAAGRGADR